MNENESRSLLKVSVDLITDLRSDNCGPKLSRSTYLLMGTWRKNDEISQAAEGDDGD